VNTSEILPIHCLWPIFFFEEPLEPLELYLKKKSLTCSEADCNEDNEDGDQRLEDDLGQHLEDLFNK
jgi:hypothetical protein